MKRIQNAHLPVVANTHPGMSGKNNEDRYAVNTFLLPGEERTPNLLAILSDGIGGHRAGEVAAEIAVNAITHAIAESDGSQPQAILNTAITHASQEIFRQSRADAQRYGMGATCAIAWIIGRQVYTATVGDSRIYLMHAGVIRQITKDHTWVQEAMEAGLITPEEAIDHPNTHVIRRYLGAPIDPEVDFRLYLTGEEDDDQATANQGFELQEGDRLLLCSDGLSDLVTPVEMLEAFQQPDMQPAVDGLIELANQRGGHDNITVIAIESPSQPLLPAKPKRSLLRMAVVAVIGAVVFCFVALLAYLGWLWSGTRPILQETATGSPPAVLTVLPGTAAVTQAPLVSPSPNAPYLPPLEDGATLTPWATHTYQPTQSQTGTDVGSPPATP
ncbi:MAG: serine/threonine-protein phosphatase [Anaerolineae bacterium]|nr:serine/threonine-protein phosphatase [Anaerolineae bacterium]